jgi:hypothetical protein
MTEREIYDGVIVEGTTDLFFVVDLLHRLGAGWSLIGGLAVNTYASPVYTADCNLVVVARDLSGVLAGLREANFSVKEHPHWTNAQRRLKRGASSAHRLMVQFSQEARYQDFPDRAALRPVFGRDLPVAALEDLVRGKVWAWSDPTRRPTKRMKDALDLMRLVEVEPAVVIPLLPAELRAQAEQVQAQPLTEDEDSMDEDA